MESAMQNQASSRSDDYLPFADGLRAVAILAVVAYHAAPWLVPGGFAGVDVFFVISGFLITRLIAPEIANGRFSLQRNVGGDRSLLHALTDAW